jgi:peptidoglycan/xylan/chitin deacetylase (PgdA/CDA1 family)
MRFYLRKLFILLMRWIGIIRLFQFIYRNQIVILMIHGVMDERDNPSWVPLRPRLSRKKLEEDLWILSRRYRFVSLEDAVDMLQGVKPMQPYSMVLTFDDGYRNNFTHALPILRRYNAPATYYIPTGFLDNPKPFWFDRLDYALQQTQVNGREGKVASFTMNLDSSNRTALRESYKRLRHTAKDLEMSDLEFLREMEGLAGQLEEESGRALADIQYDDDWSAILTWDQIEKDGNGNVTIGSHTVDHIRLGLVEAEIACDQLARSKRDIEIHTGKSCLSLCYPNGSFTDETIALAKDCGYLCGVTTKEGLNRPGDDTMRLRRVNVPTNVNSNELLMRICGLSRSMSLVRAWHIKLTKGRKKANDEMGKQKENEIYGLFQRIWAKYDH